MNLSIWNLNCMFSVCVFVVRIYCFVRNIFCVTFLICVYFVHFNLSGVWLFKVIHLDEVNINLYYAQCSFFQIDRRIYTLKLLCARACVRVDRQICCVVYTFNVCHWIYWMLETLDWHRNRLLQQQTKTKQKQVWFDWKQQNTKTHYGKSVVEKNKRKIKTRKYLQLPQFQWENENKNVNRQNENCHR